jgi:hypothetical protein
LSSILPIYVAASKRDLTGASAVDTMVASSNN